MIEAAEAFLELFKKAQPKEQSIAKLALILDQLLIAYDLSDEQQFDPTDFMDPPGIDYVTRRQLVESAFPALGFYHSIDHIEVDKLVEPSIGDAVDDLADIYADLHAVVWRWKNTSKEDAIWHFRFTFQTHWGRHLIDLRSHLHYRMFEA
ncbi:MAG: DUF5063 domain-containing protein [Beijerinckiaceae bacterium]|nr:DUF5063 domain-containing protein [Beijerinckiaceae bacterium]